MAIDVTDEIVQDFLIEASEILEQLGAQLVDLESRPEDSDLLNSVFRGFHTIKGGAGFLALDNLVEVCHKAEDIFNLLRQGERRVDAALMDVVLQVLDVLHEMFQSIRGGEEPGPAAPELLEALGKLAAGEALEAAPKPAGGAPPPPPPGQAPVPEASTAVQEPAPADGDITEEEFDALLDQLHGEGRHGGRPEVGVAVPEPSAPAAAGDLITEEEFDALLDQLHGQGKAPVPAAPPAAAVGQKEPKPEAPGEGEARGAADKGRAPKEASPQAETTVRVETVTLDRIMNMVGELVLIRNRLATLEAGIGNEDVTKTVSTLDVVTSDLQAAVMKTRMQPIKKVFGRFPRVVRDLARSLGKEVNLEMHGEDTDLDKNLVEALADPLVHLVRNAVDHGIEAPDRREAAGKPRAGTLRLSAEQEGDHILLTIADDGAGMDADLLRRKVVEKGLMDADAATRLDTEDCYQLIFLPGFSTKSEISDVSGRGVGMDVVKTRINQLNGAIRIESAPGKGTALYIKVPLTLAIMPTLMVILGRQTFALPLVNVNEILDFDSGHTNVIDGQKVMLVRGKPLPLFYLSQWLVRGVNGFPAGSGHVVVVTVGTQKVGLLVDQLIGQEEVVIKPLGALVQGTQGLAGATITGDGRIALILDLPGLIAGYARRF